jgi:hypothetical protein
MKKLFVITAVATLFGTAAFAEENVAQSYSHDFGTGNVLPAPDSGAAGALDARAQAGPHPAVRQKRSRTLSNGETDPDPNIRFQLRRELQEDESGD